MPTRQLAILVGLSRRTCQRLQYSQASRRRRSFLVYKHIQSTSAMGDIGLPTIGSLLCLSRLGSLGVDAVALLGIADQVGPSVLVILVCVFLLLTPT